MDQFLHLFFGYHRPNIFCSSFVQFMLLCACQNLDFFMNTAPILSQFISALKELQRKASPKNYSHASIVINIEQLSIKQVNLESSTCYWSAPEHGEYLAGYNICESYSTNGTQRFKQLDKQFQQSMQNWCFPEGFDNQIAFCAIAFDENDNMAAPWQDFSNSQIIIPRLIVNIKKQNSQLIFNFKFSELEIEVLFSTLLKLVFAPSIAEQEKAPLGHILHIIGKQEKHKQDWLAQVKNSIETLKQGALSKLVPSRHIRYHQKYRIIADRLLHRLSDSYPACNILSLTQGNSRLVAASPERLLKINGDKVSCDAIGGTLKRSDGQSIVNLLRHHTQSIDKLLHEHAIIVEHIYNVLDRYCEILKLPSSPGIMKLKHLIHLETYIRGKLKKPTSILALAEKLHPTPAVAGFPAQEAIQWLKENEQHKRGLYTGAAGWLTPSGNGELTVILRCALISQNDNDDLSESSVDLYAGAGIVESSSPEEEWDETELKLETILGILK